MTLENYPPISHGTSVKTTLENMQMNKEWTNEARARRKWGIKGKVVDHHDSHGLCYVVLHEDGSYGAYDPSELEVIPEDMIVLPFGSGI